jgi:hypothetical protein
VDVAVQWVITSWTKQSRGGAAAARRNAAATGFLLPLENGRPLVHEVRMDEASGFAPEEAVRVGDPRVRQGWFGTGLALAVEEDGRLRVAIAAAARAQPLHRARPPAVRLEAGRWLRWQVNYRLSWPMSRGGRWAYRLETINVAYGPWAETVFLGTPDVLVDQRGFLR